MGQSVTFVRATKSDAQRLAEFQIRAWGESYGGLVPSDNLKALSVEVRAEAWRMILGSRNRFRDMAVWMALEDDGLLGFGAAGPQSDAGLRDAGFDGEISAIYVAKAAQGHGLGRRLLRQMFAQLDEIGATAASITNLKGNRAGRRFLRATGAEPLEANIGTFNTAETELFGWRKLALAPKPIPLDTLTRARKKDAANAPVSSRRSARPAAR